MRGRLFKWPYCSVKGRTYGRNQIKVESFICGPNNKSKGGDCYVMAHILCDHVVHVLFPFNWSC